MGKRGKKTASVVMLVLAFFLTACSEGSQGDWHLRSQSPQRVAVDRLLLEGAELFALWCADCHLVRRDGETVAPDLRGVRQRRSAALLERVLVEPALFYPGTMMPPDDHFTSKERKALVRYLASLDPPPVKKEAWGKAFLDRVLHKVRLHKI